MRPTSTSIEAGRTIVALGTDNDSNILIGSWRDSNNSFGATVEVFDIPVGDVTAIELGETSVLDIYVRPDKDKPGSYDLVRCAGHLLVEGAQPVEIDSFREFQPYVSDVETVSQ